MISPVWEVVTKIEPSSSLVSVAMSMGRAGAKLLTGVRTLRSRGEKPLQALRGRLQVR